MDLDRLTVKDFRSIKGTVLLPLDAPIILVHGANGAGKTSLFSALELALTGDIPSMRRDDPSFLDHLVYQGAKQTTVSLSGPELTNTIGPGVLRVADGIIHGKGFLDPMDARFFSERCYLAQSALGRLLEIYQHADPQKDSPLTRFVKDLLGLDQLDALVDGLHDASDIRRTKNLVPEFRAAESLCRSLRGRRDETNISHRAQLTAIDLGRQQFGTLVSGLPPGFVGDSPPIPDLTAMRATLENASEDPPLITLAQHRRELLSIVNAWNALPTTLATEDRSRIESAAAAASAEVAIWREGPGKTLETVLDNLRSVFPDLPSSASTDPHTAHSTATARVYAEVDRLRTVLAQEQDAIAKQTDLDGSIRISQSRIASINEQIANLVSDAQGFSQTLAALVPHIHGEDCPVCGRDFTEVSEEPLIGYLQQRIARLTEQAGSLSALTLEKSRTINLLSVQQREREESRSKQLRQEDRLILQSRLARLSTAFTELSELASAATAGALALRNSSTANQQLANFRERDRKATDLRSATSELCIKLSQLALSQSESLPSALHRLQQFVDSEQARLENLRTARLNALSSCQHLISAVTSADTTASTAATLSTELEHREAELREADNSRLEAKAIGYAARDARTAIVRRVFNEALNSLWRDLFVRLAPTEPFVPAFKLPETTGGVVATLETLHRSGQKGGTPGAMLSAGNLNTAALTLFLALHLSVQPRLPWLLLDDPVQNMDEVHIAQFAALLRTLSKEHGRKVLIAVHDRSLFDYLSLELSPAFLQDRLITVELSRSATNASVAEPRYWTFQKDDTIAA